MRTFESSFETQTPTNMGAGGVDHWPAGKLDDLAAGCSYAMDVDKTAETSPSSSPSSSSSGFHDYRSPLRQYPYATLTPVTRFLTKQTYGRLPQVCPAGNSPNSVRLPSLTGSRDIPPLSPQSSPRVTRGQTSGFGSPVTLSPRGPADVNYSFPLLNKPFSTAPTTPLPPIHFSPADAGCRPFAYQRSQSCPSDAMAPPATAGMMELSSTTMEVETLPAIPPLSILDIPKNRVGRSSSMDISIGPNGRRVFPSAERSPAELIDLHRWIVHSNHQPLSSLAESAILHLKQQREQQREQQVQSPRDVMLKYDEQDAKPRDKKLCAFPECSSNAVTRGLCISHGGGRRCQRKGCTRGAQSKGLCVAHGGGRICRAKGCSNIQRSMGLCIRHGGGKRCSMPGCQKGVVRQDLCTAHGGKRKCRVEDCTKHVKKKGLCRSHANSAFASSL